MLRRKKSLRRARSNPSLHVKCTRKRRGTISHTVAAGSVDRVSQIMVDKVRTLTRDPSRSRIGGLVGHVIESPLRGYWPALST
jgi:mRNA-degrading endonuclease toxin of MazEF toxin-antitoxin module